MEKCNEILKESVKLSRKLSKLSIMGERSTSDTSLIQIYGFINALMKSITNLAQEEIQKHKMKGKWN